ncbi:MaoC family dehydratase [Maritalea mediterranea]|uniref:MaoC family dehydratase n=1 Tax=Maritalea mediterranea TaxID=2909667 RepID=A0ABS9E6Q6_9HYPH|nr:MaoC family dehydratase [Maritalea mediterranea]MCF4097141.1 MaoC family dehydratase [Maritalea mediterranea]
MIEINQIADWTKYLGATFEDASPRAVTPTQLDAFLQASGDANAIHRGDEAIIPGNLLLSLVPHFVQRHLSLANTIIGMSVGYDKVRFKNAVKLAEPLFYKAEVVQVRMHHAAAFVTYQVVCESAGQVVMSIEMRDHYAQAKTEI